MSRTFKVTLSDVEHRALAAMAKGDRRTVNAQAAFIITSALPKPTVEDGMPGRRENDTGEDAGTRPRDTVALRAAK